MRSGEHSITAAIDAVVVAALTGLSEHDAARLLDDLLDVHLLQQRQPGRYRFHDLVGEYAAAACARLDPPGARQAAVTLWVPKIHPSFWPGRSSHTLIGSEGQTEHV